MTVHFLQSSFDLQVLTDATASPLKRADHKYAIQRELDAVRKLRGALNIAAFEDAYEDNEHVYIITELCRGGELWHRVGDKHYSERTVSSCLAVQLEHSHALCLACHCRNQDAGALG